MSSNINSEENIKRSSAHLFQKDKWSLFRLITFLTSVRGYKKLWNLFFRVIRYGLKKVFKINFQSKLYKKWLKKHTPTQAQLNKFKNHEQKLNYRPKISIILPVYNPPEEYFKAAIQSVLSQVYTNWELCIADDCSTNLNIKTIIKEFSEQDDRIKYVFRKENGHISASSNSAIEIATGEFIALLDHDDLITPDALYENVLALNNNKELDLIYSDEDNIDVNGTLFEPHFKPDWCPDNLLCRNYICHFTIIRTKLVKQVGAFRLGYEGSQDYDLFLRVTEQTTNIHHIAKILYHWRIHEESTALNNAAAKPYIYKSGIKALKDALNRREIGGEISAIDNSVGYYSIRYKIINKQKVSIIIPTKNQTELTNTCITSIFNLTTYPDYEVVLMDNNSSEESFFKMVKTWEDKEPDRFKCISDKDDFNFSRLMNTLVKNSNGEYLLLLNNDIEVIHEDWMDAMVEQAQRESIGAVGAKLMYKNNTIQHAGVVIGLGGIAGHCFVGKEPYESGYFNYIQSINNFSAVTAACLMVKRTHFNEVNGFDEDLAVEFNDVDFCLKLKERGYNNICLPHVTLYHYESVSRGHPHKTKESYERHVRENNLFKKRWQKYIDYDPCYNQNLSLTFDDFRIKSN